MTRRTSVICSTGMFVENDNSSTVALRKPLSSIFPMIISPIAFCVSERSDVRNCSRRISCREEVVVRESKR